MKKLLYISVNSKPEEKSTSKTVARKLINKIKDIEECDVYIKEIDLYKEHIPTLTDEYFCGRNAVCYKEDYSELNHRARNEVDRIKYLANEFKEADIYVVAAPMWSLFFPAPLKQYLDCVIQNGITIDISEKGCKGLLSDKERKFYFVQSSGGNIPLFIKGILDHGSAYLKDITKAMGISKYKEILVDGTGFTEEERLEAIESASDEIDCMFKVETIIGKACDCYKEKKENKKEKHFTYKIKCCNHHKNKFTEEKEYVNIEDDENEYEEDKAYAENNDRVELKEETVKENQEEEPNEVAEEVTRDKIETYEKMENDNILNRDAAEDYNDNPV